MTFRSHLPSVSSARRSLQPPGSAEDDLVARIRNGDEAAFERLFAQHYGSLCSFAFSLVGAADVAEDIVQAAFLGIWSRRHTWEPADGMRAYLFGACRNRAFDYLRHRRLVAQKAPQLTVALQSEVAARHRQPGVALEADDLRAHLSRIVNELPARRRLVVILRWQHQLTNREIARVLGISEKGVETQFGRALAALRKRFTRTVDRV